MKLIGLTGGIGMGKSTSASWLREHGIPLVDTDDLARDVVEPGQPALAEIRAAFGQSMIDDQGRLRRELIARVIFSSPERRRELEAITHPRIRARWEEQIEAWRKSGASMGVVVIPLLFETAAEPSFDTVVCLACAGPTQRERLRLRGWSAEAIESRIRAQWPIERKMTASRFVIWSEGPLEILGAQWEQVIARVKKTEY